MSFLYPLFVNTVGLLVIAYLLKGFHVANVTAALVAALVLGIVNVFIKPILLVLTLPLNILTLGLFTFVVNAALLKLVSAVVPGIRIDTWGTAILAAVIMALISVVLLK